ncbi:MAG: glycosyltransferase family 2 protein, partial [Planctomycetota bacterium]
MESQYEGSAMIKIQNVILNHDICPESTSLFYTFEERLNSFVLNFGTYFNSLWPQIWKEYTNITGFYLNILFKGTCTLSIIESQLSQMIDEKLPEREISHNTLYRKQHSCDGTTYVQIKFPVIDPACRIIHFELEYGKKSEFEYIDAFYSVENSLPPNNVKTAIIICTFQREDYVYKNIAAMKSYFNENPELAEVYDIFVIDNGKTVSKDIESNNIYLFPNKNTGGTGGFTRGILEAIQSPKNYTHVILMDDDVEIIPESLHRTYTLTSLINDEHSRSFISGSMLRGDIKDSQWEARARLKGLFPEIYGKLNLSKFSRLPENEAAATRHTRYDYAAWWYCCIPLKSIGPNKLPFPFFLRGDDIDYSLKFAHKVIHLNGICIWHEPFDSRLSNVMDLYTTVRNFLTIN